MERKSAFDDGIDKRNELKNKDRTNKEFNKNLNTNTEEKYLKKFWKG